MPLFSLRPRCCPPSSRRRASVQILVFWTRIHARIMDHPTQPAKADSIVMASGPVCPPRLASPRSRVDPTYRSGSVAPKTLAKSALQPDASSVTTQIGAGAKTQKAARDRKPASFPFTSADTITSRVCPRRSRAQPLAYSQKPTRRPSIVATAAGLSKDAARAYLPSLSWRR